MAVTLKDVAALAGVSVPTANQVLKPQPGRHYSAETCRKVIAAATKLGYRPNGYAQAMRTGRFNCVSLLLSTEDGHSTIPNGLIDGLHAALDEAELQLNVSRLPDARLTHENYIPKILRTLLVDGLLINYNCRIPAKMPELIARHRIPSVYINSKWQCNCVYPDEFVAGRTAAEELLKRGHEQIAYVDLSVGRREVLAGLAHFSVTDREAGYREAMAAAGRVPIILREPESVPGAGRSSLLSEWLIAHPDVTAVIDGAGSATIPLLVAGASQGRLVGEVLHVVCIGDVRRHFGAPVHRVGHSGFLLGRRAAELIARLLRERAPAVPPVVLRPSFISLEDM